MANAAVRIFILIVVAAGSSIDYAISTQDLPILATVVLGAMNYC